MSNSYLDVLEKIANQLQFEEPMNPESQPIPDEGEVAEVQAEQPVEQALPGSMNDEEAAIQEQVINEDEIAMQEQAIEEMKNRALLEKVVTEEVLPTMSDEELEDVLVSKVAQELTSLGTLAKLAEYASGENEYITEDMQKQASDIIENMVSSEDVFNQEMERLASELFSNEDVRSELNSRDGLAFVFEQLANFDDFDFEKQADEDMNAIQKLKNFAGSAVESTKNKVNDAIYSARNLGSIGEELQNISAQVENQISGMESIPYDQLGSANNELKAMMEQESLLKSQKRLGNATRYGGGAALAGGAIYGGKKLYDHLNDGQEEKIAGVLPVQSHDGTLNLATETETNGGIQKMSNQLVQDFLKVAGAAGLVSIANDESLDNELRKEASDAFDHIANLGSTDMNNALVKVAQEIYSSDELHEIVAGQHTDHLMDKVAFFIDATESSTDELEKVANAGGVSAIKAMGAGLKNAGDNIANTIGKAKDKAEGAGREYVGTLKAHPGAVAGTGAAGLAGGGLVGSLAGYNMINNPEEYDIEQTAAALEEAYMTKQAATEAFAKADAFIEQYGHLVK